MASSHQSYPGGTRRRRLSGFGGTRSLTAQGVSYKDSGIPSEEFSASRPGAYSCSYLTALLSPFHPTYPWLPPKHNNASRVAPPLINLAPASYLFVHNSLHLLSTLPNLRHPIPPSHLPHLFFLPRDLLVAFSHSPPTAHVTLPLLGGINSFASCRIPHSFYLPTTLLILIAPLLVACSCAPRSQALPVTARGDTPCVSS